MQYVFPYGAVDKLRTLRSDYEQRSGVVLSKHPGFFGMPKSLGGKDVATRNIQVLFIEKILCTLASNLYEKEELNTPENIAAHYTASKMLASACLYVQSQIDPNYKLLSSEHSDLYYLINNALEISAANPMDDEDKNACFQTSKRLLSLPNAFDQANQQLRKANLSPFTEKEWQAFSGFVFSQIKDSDEADTSNWPFSNLCKKGFGNAGETVGATMGIISGQVLCTSSHLLPTKNYITATIGQGVILFGVGSAFGTPFVVPILASKLMGTFLQVFLAQSLRYIFRVTGEKVGTAVGIPMDLVYQLLCSVCDDLIQGFYADPSVILSGIRIADGQFVSNGVIVQIPSQTELKELTPEQKENAILFKEDGSFNLGQVKHNVQQFLPEVIDELRTVISQSRLKSKLANLETQSAIPAVPEILTV